MTDHDNAGFDGGESAHLGDDDGSDVATLLRTVDLGSREPVDVDAILAAAAHRRRLRTAERVLAVAATVALIAATAVGVARLRAPAPVQVAASDVALPATVLGPDSAYPYGVPLGTPGGKPTVVVWNDPQSPLGGQFETQAGAKLRTLAESGRVYLVVRPAIFLDDAHPESRGASLRAVEAWGCMLDEGAGFGDRFIDRVLTQQPTVEGEGWTDARLADLAAQSGLSGPGVTRFSTCLSSGTYAAWARASQGELTRSGVAGVPTVYVDGQEVPHDGTSDDWTHFVADPGAWIAARS